MKRRIWLCALCLLLFLCVLGFPTLNDGGRNMPETASVTQRSSREIIRDLTACYAKHGENARDDIDLLLRELGMTDPDAALRWERIMTLWSEVNRDLTLHEGVLPDGLCDTDELCIVALGFQLNPDGTMREELMERLRVVLASAEKYPNALIVCTGGPTAYDDPTVTEAGRMAEWLIAQGVDSRRLIVEDRSLTTSQNAIFSYRILAEQYPRVRQLAIVTSDYHIASGMLLFGTEAILKAERAWEVPVTVVSNACCRIPNGALSVQFQASALNELAAEAAAERGDPKLP